MRPHWLSRFRAWVEPTPAPGGHDPRPWWARVAVFIGWRKEF